MLPPYDQLWSNSAKMTPNENKVTSEDIRDQKLNVGDKKYDLHLC